MIIRLPRNFPEIKTKVLSNLNFLIKRSINKDESVFDIVFETKVVSHASS